ncbi:MAG: hypothetical protein D6812_00040, partial [Deltaproteobacteria bacterium]
YNDIVFMIDAEEEIGRGYADLVMIVRPDMRRFEVFDILLEFKYVDLSDAGVTGEGARSLPEGEIRALPAVKRVFEDAGKQLAHYAAALHRKYGETLRLRTFAVVSLGFERVVGEEVGRDED